MKKKLLILSFVAAAMSINAQTSDMKMVSVQGPVKQILYKESCDPVLNVNLILFNRDGWISELVPSFYEASHDVATMKRTSYNLLDSWEIYCCDTYVDDRLQKYEFSYGSQTYVRQVSASFLDAGYDADITWDESGRVKKIEIKGGAEMLEFTYITTYSYTKTDRYGNWIEADYIRYITDKFDEQPENRSTEKGKITRSIAYYN